MTNSVKFFCSYLSEHMDGRRHVCRPRAVIATDLGVSERAVNRYVAATREAGFLGTIERGQKGRTAVYQGLFPEPPPMLQVLNGGAQ